MTRNSVGGSGLSVRDVLDQATEAQLTRGGALGGLLVGQITGREAQ
jgi:hypothetical protein